MGLWKAFVRNRLAVIGGVVVLGLVTLAAMAPWLSPWDPNRPDVRESQVFLDIREQVNTNGSEMGLLGLAFSPRFATDSDR